MQKYQIWREGYLVSGMDVPATATLLGGVAANSFKDACDKVCSDEKWQSMHGNYDQERLTVWGCRLFDNEADARRTFG